jgi:hypothetical protein
MFKPFVPQREPESKTLYRNPVDSPLTKKQHEQIRIAAVEGGMKIVPYGAKGQSYVIPSGAELHSGIPEPGDIYAFIGFNYVRVVDMFPENKDAPTRESLRSGLVESFKKIIESKKK